MKKTFVTNLALLLFVNLLIKPFWIFGIDRTVQNIVGAHEYGLYASLFSFSIILNIILDFGITNFNNRNIAQNSHLLKKYFSNIIVLKFLLGIVYAVVCFGIGAAMGYSAYQYYLLIFLVANQFLLSGILYLRSNLTGLHLFKTDSFISVTDRAISIILCSGALYLHKNGTPFRIDWFIYAQTAAYLITFLIAFFIVLTQAQFFKLRIHIPFLLLIVKQSFPFALLILLMSLYTRVDIVMIERMLPDGGTQAGIFVQAFRILDAVTMFGLLFANILLPLFAGMIKRKEPIEQLAVMSFFILMVPTLIISIGSLFYSTELMKMMYFDHFSESAPIFSVLILGFIAFSTTYIFGTLLTANSSLRLLNYMAAAGMATNIILNLWLIPIYQAWGAALASLITQSVTALIQLVIAARIFKFSVNIGNISRMLLYAGSLVAIFALTKGLTGKWLWDLMIGSAIGGISAMVFRIINIKAMLQILRKDEQ